MSNYTKATDFAAKDALASGNPSKVVQGTEIDAEFEAIETAVNSKADANTAALTSPVISGGTIDNAVIGGTTPAAGTFTTLNGTTCTFTTLVGSAGTLDNIVIGGTTPAAGTFTTVTSVSWSGLPTVTAGNGLTGGGDLDSGNITLNVVAGTGITVAADSVSFDTTWGDARYLQSYSETDTLATVTGRGATTSTGITVSNFVKATTFRETSTSIAASAIDCSLGNVFYKTLSANTTFTFSNVPSSGNAFGITVVITQGGSAYTITWPAAVKWDGGSAPAVPAAGDVAIYSLFTYDGGTTWYGVLAGSDFA